MEPYSVLMSVYYKDNPDHLHQAIQSIKEQSIPYYDFVIVCDGPLSPELDNELDSQCKNDDRITLIRLPQNKGLGAALNAGLDHCKCDLVARMDADDISLPDRCQQQLEIFNRTPSLSMCSGYVSEFNNNPSITHSVRIVPETNHEIYNYAKSRNPFNHPCMMYRKKCIQCVGGYKKDYPFFEDYDLWLRMLWDHQQAYNIQDTILLMRTGNGMYKRRGGINHMKSTIKLFHNMYNHKYISIYQYLFNLTTRLIIDSIPVRLRSFIYKKILREP